VNKAAVICFTGKEREEERNGESEKRRIGAAAVSPFLRFTGSRFTTGVLNAGIANGPRAVSGCARLADCCGHRDVVGSANIHPIA
jgi:hypothetical protein